MNAGAIDNFAFECLKGNWESKNSDIYDMESKQDLSWRRLLMLVGCGQWSDYGFTPKTLIKLPRKEKKGFLK